MLNDVDELSKEVLAAKNTFEQILEQIVQEKLLSRKERLAYKAIDFALNASTGYYSSEIIENVFLALAQQNRIELPSEHRKNSFLHVMTEAYATGGHTRVVERWIELSDASQVHSLLFTREKKKYVPDRLAQAVKNKQGNISFLSDKLTNIEKGLQLRHLASEYEYIILHVHMEDVIPLIAFGTLDFKRPVLLFNHADHRFWLGGSVADKIIDFRQWGQNITLNKRGLVNSVILELPLDFNEFDTKYDRCELRKKLGLPQDHKIIVTVGSAHKYKPLLNYDFLNFIIEVLNDDGNCSFIAIGPDYKKLPLWENAHKKFKNRFRALGPKATSEMFEYLACADLSVDSFPMSGGTALIDAVTVGCPVLSLKCPTGQLDYVINSDAYCNSQKDLRRKIHLLLQNPRAQKENVANVQEKLMQQQSTTSWLTKLKSIYLATTEHSLHNVNTPNVCTLTDLDLYLYTQSISRKTKFKIPFIIEWNRVKENGKKYNQLLLLNKFQVNI